MEFIESKDPTSLTRYRVSRFFKKLICQARVGDNWIDAEDSQLTGMPATVYSLRKSFFTGKYILQIRKKVGDSPHGALFARWKWVDAVPNDIVHKGES